MAAAGSPFRCETAALYFPAYGEAGWKHQDPGSTDSDPRGNRTLHTGLDIFAEAGDGAPIYAPADGFISRQPGVESVNIVLPGVSNVLTGEAGIEIYLSHVRHALVSQQTFKAGDIIAVQLGDHLHFSVGAFTGYDDRELSQTQDPSPYFTASLSYDPETLDRHDVMRWCRPASSFVASQLKSTASLEASELRIGRQDCLPDGRVSITLPANAVRAGDWVDLSILNNDFAADFLGKRAISSDFRWDGLTPGTPHFLRVNRPVDASWIASPTVLFLTRSDC